MTIRILAACVVAVTLSTYASAQKTFDEWAGGKNLSTPVELPKPKIYKLDLKKDGSGQLVHYPSIPPIKKMAIVSFTTTDIQTFERKVYGFGGDYGKTTISKSRWVNEDVVLELQSMFYKQAVPALQAFAKTKGIELLEVKDVLTDDALKSFYKSFEPTPSKFGGKIIKMGKNLDEKATGKSNGTQATHPQYQFYDMAMAADWKFNKDMGTLCKKLGMDAIIVVINNVSNDDSKTLNLMASGVYVFGPNPIPDPNKKFVGSGAMQWHDGHLWWGVELGCGKDGKDGFPFYVIKKDEMNLTGYEKMPVAALQHCLDKIQKSSELGK